MKSLGDYLNLTESAIGMYERGERTPNFEVLEEIADFFNVDMDFLLGRTNIPNRYQAQTIAAHFDGDEYTEDELEEIKKFAEFVKQRRNKQ